jgi:hypothetical protein
VPKYGHVSPKSKHYHFNYGDVIQMEWGNELSWLLPGKANDWTSNWMYNWSNEHKMLFMYCCMCFYDER